MGQYATPHKFFSNIFTRKLNCSIDYILDKGELRIEEKIEETCVTI